MSALINEQIAHEQTKVELYKAQFQILDLIGRQSMEKITSLKNSLPQTEDQTQAG